MCTRPARFQNTWPWDFPNLNNFHSHGVSNPQLQVSQNFNQKTWRLKCEFIRYFPLVFTLLYYLLHHFYSQYNILQIWIHNIFLRQILWSATRRRHGWPARSDAAQSRWQWQWWQLKPVHLTSTVRWHWWAVWWLTTQRFFNLASPHGE